MSSKTSQILCAIRVNSFSFIPSVVNAALPKRIPEVDEAGRGSEGIEFLLTVIPAFSNATLASSPGNEIVVEVILSDRSLYPNKGKISFISPTVDSVTGTRMLRAEIINPKGELAPGEFMKIRIRGLKQERIVIPDKALMQGAKGTFVYVVGAKKIAESRLVKVGNWINHDVIILDGLKEGEKIVYEGNARVDAGKVVKIASDQSTK